MSKAGNNIALRASLFAVESLISATIPLFLINLAVVIYGKGTFADIAVAQAWGTVASLVVLWGWTTTGPQAVAAATTVGRVDIFNAALVSKTWTAALVVSVAGLYGIIVGVTVLQIVAFISTLVAAFAPGWFYVGVGSSMKLLLVDTLPRTGASLLGVVLGYGSHSVLILLLMQTVGPIVSLFVSLRDIGRKGSGTPADWRLASAGRTLWRNRSAAATSAITALYVNLPLPIVSLLAPSSAGLLAAAQRVQKFALAGVSPLTSTLIGWMPDADPARFRTKLWHVALVSMLSVVLVGSAVAMLSGPTIRLLADGQIVLSSAQAVLLGVLLGAVAGSQLTGLVCLIPAGRVTAVLHSTSIGAGVGLGGMAVLVRPLGASGALVSLALAELCVYGYQLAALASHLRKGIHVE